MLQSRISSYTLIAAFDLEITEFMAAIGFAVFLGGPVMVGAIFLGLAWGFGSSSSSSSSPLKSSSPS